MTYLEPARRTYLEILRELVSDRLPSGEFTDRKIDIYPEIHQVYMSIGRTRLLHFYDLGKGKEALEEAYNISKRDQWNQPLYAATALNELARILRFEGNFGDALNKATLAISIYKKEMTNPEYDVNFGYFFETLGLIYKEEDQFSIAKQHLTKALQIYNNIQGPMDLRKATIILELGHVDLLEGDLDSAKGQLFEANQIFKSQAEKNPWYYLNSIEKLGEYYIEIKDYEKARKCFEDQRKLAKKFGHDLWEYWAIQHLASINYRQNRIVDTKRLEMILKEYDQHRGRQFGPAFWRTKLLLFRISKDAGKKSLALYHLAQGLAYLAENWKALFQQNFQLLRNELLDLDSKNLVKEAERLRKFWKNRFTQDDPMPMFLEMLDELIVNL
jgi:tetratricopeptide (TPR) repeat protein